ncbi:MAG: hypothetical protein WCK05_08455, partial [Planctomycetota bacterium]
DAMDQEVLRREGQVARLDRECQEMQQRLAELEPEHIASEIARLTTALDSARREQRDKERRQDQVLGEISGIGAAGVHERIGSLQAKVEATRERVAREQMHARALRLLHQTMRLCREETIQELMEPLRKKVLPLLCLIFREAQIGFRIDEASGQLTLEPLVRHENQESFAQLSMGTREQVGIAVRLALGQILASKYDGCLPVVLDEPFVHSDPFRQQRALGMLNLVRQNLQVIVLTCDRAGYRELGLQEGQVTELTPVGDR